MTKAATKALQRLVAENRSACTVTGNNTGKLYEKLARRLGIARSRVPSLIKDAGLVEVCDHNSHTISLKAS